MINVVILKPTRDCNADCSYCSSPPDNEGTWTIDDFKVIFDRLAPGLSDYGDLIWHGGEPMLLGPDFYREAYAYARSKKPNIKFSIQTNLLLYKSSRWKDVFENVFKGSISTSFEFDNKNRTVKGNADKYTKQFYNVIEQVLNDGFFPLVIGTYTQATAHHAREMYQWSYNRLKEGGKAFDIRVNYMFPTGRSEELSMDDGINPEQYGNLLVDLFDEWVSDYRGIDIVPLSEMFRKVTGLERVNKCPWTSSCGGHFLAVEPNGDLYNCSEFADIGDKSFSFGNVFRGTYYGSSKAIISGFERKMKADDNYGVQIMKTPAARQHKRREAIMPQSCFTCEHFKECEGGCHRDSVLFERGFGGKFAYCQSWKMVFKRIKEAVRNGETDAMLDAYGITRDDAIKYMDGNPINENLIYAG